MVEKERDECKVKTDGERERERDHGYYERGANLVFSKGEYILFIYSYFNIFFSIKYGDSELPWEGNEIFEVILQFLLKVRKTYWWVFVGRRNPKYYST